MNLNTQEKLPMIPYGRQYVDQDDIDSVSQVLSSDWLTTGPKVSEFEEKIADFVGNNYGVAVSSGTAALHAVMHVLEICPEDEVIVPAMTFAATANAVVYQGGRPIFADVDKETLLISPESVEKLITPRTKAIVGVDYAGHPCDYDTLRGIADSHGIALVADGCHSLGAVYKGRSVGVLADMTVFSFHPVKHMTTGEGGMVVTDNNDIAAKIQRFRNHGISSDSFKRQQEGTWHYEMVELGFNYRISDIQCALGISQLNKLPGWLERRRKIAGSYDRKMQDFSNVSTLLVQPEVEHAFHLYVISLAEGVSREKTYQKMHKAGVGVNVHYVPVHMHPFYIENFGTETGLCPVAEKAYEQLLSLPMHQGLSEQDLDRVITALREAVG